MDGGVQNTVNTTTNKTLPGANAEIQKNRTSRTSEERRRPVARGGQGQPGGPGELRVVVNGSKTTGLQQ